MCSVKDLINKHLFGFGKCMELKNVHEQVMNNLTQTLYQINQNKASSDVGDFDDWYDVWKKRNENK